MAENSTEDVWLAKLAEQQRKLAAELPEADEDGPAVPFRGRIVETTLEIGPVDD